MSWLVIFLVLFVMKVGLLISWIFLGYTVPEVLTAHQLVPLFHFYSLYREDCMKRLLYLSVLSVFILNLLVWLQ